MRLALLLALAPVLAACSTLNYQEPTSGPRARVRFVTDTTDITVVRSYGDLDCSTDEQEWMRLRKGVLLNSSPKQLGIPLWPNEPNAAKEVYVQAGKPLSVMFYGSERVGTTLHTCGVPIFFTFEEGRDYEVRYHQLSPQCDVSVSQVVGDPAGAVKKRLAEFSNRVTAQNTGCLAAFKKTRLY